jgi:hypothetical protein
LAILVISTPLFAKNNITIYGKIIEKENGKALPFATIIIHSKEKKILSGTTSSLDGSFSLENTGEVDCELKISFIGFRDTTLTLSKESSANSINLGTIALSGDMIALNSAVITSRVPLIEQKLDKIVMNVAEAIITHGSDALEILKKAPGVSIDPSGKILLNGSPVEVWMDGRPSNMTGADLESLLSGTDGSTIDKIEIIAHPSSKYDAAGSGGIINIRTKRNFAHGVNGSFRAGYTAAPYEKYYHQSDATLVINNRGVKNSTSFTYSPRFSNGFNRFTTMTDMGDGSITHSNSMMLKTFNGHTIKLSNDYFASKKSIFGFVVSGSLRDFTDSTDSSTGSEFYKDGSMIGSVSTKIVSRYKFDNISANLNYTHIFRDNQEITINGDYFIYDQNRSSDQYNHYFGASGFINRDPVIFKTYSEQLIKILSIKSDYEHSFGDKTKMEAGAKWARSKTDNDLIWKDKTDEIWIPNISQSTLFYYTEDVSAGYVNISNKISPKFNIKAGLRAELTQSTGEWITADTVTKKQYLDLFPTIFAGYTPNKIIRTSLSYSMRIQRPNFEQLNPQRYYIDATSSAQGNPNIEPEYIHQLNLSLGISQHFNFGINARFTNNNIVQTPSFDPLTGDKLLTWDNFGKLNMIGINATITEFPVKKWLIINSNIFVSHIESTLESYSTRSLFTQGNLSMAILLPKDAKIELSGFYQSGLPYGFFNIKPKSDFTFGVKKGVFKSKGTISLLATDILGTNYNRVSLTDNVFKKYEFEQRGRSRRVTLTFSYRFGQGKALKQRKVGNIEESSRVNSGN